VVNLGGILGGIFTATEAAAIAVVLAAVIGWKKLKLADMPGLLLSAGRSTAQVMLIVATSAILGFFLAGEQLPQAVAAGLLGISHNKWVILAMLNVLFLIVRLFLNSTPTIILLVPILMPLVRQVGIDPIHFGLVLTINLGIGQQTPPVASVLLTTCAIAKISIDQIFKAMWYFLAAMLVVLLLVTYWPPRSFASARRCTSSSACATTLASIPPALTWKTWLAEYVIMKPGQDNVATAVVDLPAGTTLVVGDTALTLLQPIKFGHKFAVRAIAAGESVIKYGQVIGAATLAEQVIPAWSSSHRRLISEGPMDLSPSGLRIGSSLNMCRCATADQSGWQVGDYLGQGDG
jgi:hypothetical protein